jgi:hypothetical protein
MRYMVIRQSLVALVVLMLSAVAICQCVSGEKDPVRSRTRQIVDPNGKGVPGADVTVYDATGTFSSERTQTHMGNSLFPASKETTNGFTTRTFTLKSQHPASFGTTTFFFDPAIPGRF